VPNLVETVKGYASHEKTVFENVTKARSMAMQASTPADKAKAENFLRDTLKSLFALAEAYPELKANANFMQLQSQLKELEDNIENARRYFNAVVRDFNILIESFPSNIIAGSFGFKQEEFFELKAEVRETGKGVFRENTVKDNRKIPPNPPLLKGGKGCVPYLFRTQADSPRRRKRGARGDFSINVNSILRHLLYPASCIILLLLLFPATAFAQDFTINRFHSDITVNEDSSITVRETILVRFHTSKHGIYREIPFKYTDERGNTIKTPLRVLSVTDHTGKARTYKTTKKGNIVNIRIGDAKNYVEGLQTYEITYGVENTILFFDDHDELYWNVTGNYWWSPIQEASANVTLAVRNKSENLWSACYTGVSGQKNQRAVSKRHIIQLNFLQRKSPPSRRIHNSFGWDKGLVTPPPAWKKFL
jgi:LemA protein